MSKFINLSLSYSLVLVLSLPAFAEVASPPQETEPTQTTSENSAESESEPTPAEPTSSQEESQTSEAQSTDSQSEQPEPSTTQESNQESLLDDPKPELKELNLSEVISKTIGAYGGEDALTSLSKSAQIFGKLIPPSGKRSGAFYAYRKFRKNKRWRVDLEAPPGQSKLPTKRILAFNGLAGWLSVSDSVSDLNPVRLTQLNDDNECQPDLLSKWGDEDYKFRFLGKTTFRQVPVYSVLVTNKEDRDATLFIDRRNFLVVGVKYKTRGKSDGSNRTVSIEYSQYRPISGTMFPYKQTRYVNGRLASELSITSVLLDEPVLESIFDRPQTQDTIRLSRPVHVKFDFYKNEVLVKGRLNNGEELVFLFDTGASDTIIDRRVAAEHFLTKQGKDGMMAASGRVDVDHTKIKRIELGNLIVNDLGARVLSLAPQSHQMGRRIAGIIGTNLIKKFVVKLDYGKSEITFFDTNTYKRPTNANSVPFIQPNVPVINVSLNNRTKVPMLVDTGAALNNLPTAVARKQLGGAASQVSHTTEATGVDGKRIKLGNIVIDKITIGNQLVKGANFTYVHSGGNSAGAKSDTKTDSKVVQEKGGFFSSKSIGILGNPFWKNFVMVVDYKFQRLLLAANPRVRIKESIERNLKAGDKSLLERRDYRASESFYRKALLVATNSGDKRYQAELLGRLANMRRMMAKDLSRPEHTKSSYEYFIKAQNLAIEAGASDVRGRILADWSLLYNDNGQIQESAKWINQALLLAPNDPQVNVDYAIHLSRQGHFAQMQKYIEKALFTDPSNWLALWLQYKLADKFFDYPKALLTLKEIRKYYPSSKLAVKKIAEVKFKMKNQPVQQNATQSNPNVQR